MLGGPCDDLALEVGSRLTAALQAVYGDPCKVTVGWDGGSFGLYVYRAQYDQAGAIQYVTADLLAQAIGLDMVAAELFRRVTDDWYRRGTA